MKTKLLLFAMFLLAGFTMKAQTPCNAAFTFTVNPSGLVTFYSSSTSITATQSFSWSFGNATYGSGTQTTCTYNAPGTYLVCLTVADSSFLGGCIDTSCATITIPGTSGCNAMFTLVADSAAGPGNWLGYNWSTGTGLSYTWNWGDGNTSTGAYPSHSYAASGTYTICLTVMGGGCVDSVCQTYILKTGSMVNVNFVAPTAVHNVTKDQAQLYPNPAENSIYIKGSKSMNYHVDIYNLNGSKVLSANAAGNEAINIKSLPANLYMVKVTDANGKSEFAKFTKE